MTLDELAMTLPNGFHDAELSSFTIDYARREVEMKMKVWVEEEGTQEAETYREAIVTLSGLLFCVIEPPDPRYSYRDPGSLTIDTGTVESLKTSPQTRLPAEITEGAFTDWIFVNQWNAFIYVSAIAARLDWAGEPEPIP